MDVKGDDLREVVLAVIENNVTAGIGLIEKQTPHGKIISLKPLGSVSRPTQAQLASPRTFDLAAGTAGKLKLVRCYYQLSNKFVYSSSQPEFTPAAGTVYAVIDTSVEAGSVTAVMNFSYDSGTPELFPIALYKLDEAGTVLCDLRGSQVVIHG
jgi:hypothetical protein